MKRLFSHLLFSFLFSISMATAAAAQDLPVAEPGEVGMSAAGLANVTSAIQQLIDQRRIAGAVTIIARRGKVVHFEAQGERDIAGKKPMRKDSIFRIYSMTKAVVSVGVMLLVEEGKLELDAPASRYIPALGQMVAQGKPQERGMTLRDLLRHTAGFPNNVTTDRALRSAGHPSLAESTLEEMMDRLDVVPLRYQPGKGWHYSFATDVVARLLEIGSGMTVDRFLHERIFKPLGMVDTAFYCPKENWDRFVVTYGRGLEPTIAPQPGTSGPWRFDKAPKFLSGGGGLVSTATDYMRFCLMLSGKGEFAGTRLLRTETVEAMTRNQIPDGVGEISRRPEGRGFGLGFAVRTREIPGNPSPLGEYEWLGGAGTEFFLSPRDDLAVITLSQQMPMISLKSTIRPIVYGAIKDRRAARKSAGVSGNRKTALERTSYLLLDARVVDSTTNAKLTPGDVVKHSANPLFVESEEWEPRYDNMDPNVIYDEEENLYKCWYSPFIVDERTSKTAPAKRNPGSTDYMSAKPNRREEALLYATSDDGIHWEKPELGHDVTIFRDGDVYLGLLGCMNYPSKESRDGVRQHVELAWSPDSYTWHRIAPGTPFIGPTSAREETFGATPYDWGNLFAAQPVFRDGEIRIYYGASDWYFFDWRRGSLALATLRPDSWAGYESIDAERPATVQTLPIAWIGDALRVTATVGEGGSVEVSLFDRAGKRVASSRTLRRTIHDGEVSWLSNVSPSDLEGQPARLRFTARNAKVFSFSFAN